MKQNLKLFYALIAGALLPLAFAPIGFYPLAFISPAILLTLWLDESPKKAFRIGYFFGVGFFGVGASWIFVSIHQFGNTGIFLATFLTACFVLFLALFTACQGYLVNNYFIETSIRKLCLAFPASWVLLEWVRTWFLTGFPWLFLGASQTSSALRGFAPLIGEYGLSFIVACISGALVLILKSYPLIKTLPEKNPLTLLKTRAITTLFLIIILWGTGDALTYKTWGNPIGPVIRVSLVQGNIPQQMKWDPAYLDMTLRRYVALTQSNWQSKIIIWPEAAIPWLQSDAAAFLTSLNEQAKQHQATVITGIPVQDGFTYYNAIITLGTGQGTYYKRQLVPFGEYVPFDRYLRGLIGFFNIPMSDFSPGPMHQSQLHAENLTIAPFICYEIAYPKLVLASLPQANILITLSNDAWFGHSFAMDQHLQIAQLRALETQRYLLFTNNTGGTVIITPQGKIQNTAPDFQTAVVTGNVQGRTGTTPIVFIGVFPFILLIGGIFIYAASLEYRKVPPRGKSPRESFYQK